MNSKSINANQPVKRNRSGGGRPFHSRLEPFTGFIREQRQQPRTWQEIAAWLPARMISATNAAQNMLVLRAHPRQANRARIQIQL